MWLGLGSELTSLLVFGHSGMEKDWMGEGLLHLHDARLAAFWPSWVDITMGFVRSQNHHLGS